MIKTCCEEQCDLTNCTIEQINDMFQYLCSLSGIITIIDRITAHLPEGDPSHFPVEVEMELLEDYVETVASTLPDERIADAVRFVRCRLQSTMSDLDPIMDHCFRALLAAERKTGKN